MNTDPQLEMAWPERLRRDPPAVVPPAGYLVRPHRAGEESELFALMALAGWPEWDGTRLRPWAERFLPGGWLVVVDERTGDIVASAMALRSEAFAHAGELGWLAGDPAHAGRGIGRAVSAAVTVCMLEEGCWPLHLYTEHERHPALRTYLTLGYEPVLAAVGAGDQWREVCAAVAWPYTPQAWATWADRGAVALPPPALDAPPPNPGCC